MTTGKLENLLNAALLATEEEREKSKELETGYDAVGQTWEVIVKYHGSLDFAERTGIQAEPLMAGYAILTVPSESINILSEINDIEYVEKPKRLYFQIQEGIKASCIPSVTMRSPYLSGKGILIAVIDSGIDYEHEVFRREDGSTKIRYLWDQSYTGGEGKEWKRPEGFLNGVELDAGQINHLLEQPEGGERERGQRPGYDRSGHGTAVAGIAMGVAPESELLVVKLGEGRAEGFPRTTELMRAVTYVMKKATALDMPVAVNLSFGNTYGSHDGSSLLERFIDNAGEVGRCVFCVGSGNEGAAGGHTSGRVKTGSERVEFSVGNYQTAFSIQIWKAYKDDFRITLLSPGGKETVFLSSGETGSELKRIRLEETEILIYVGEPTPYAVSQEIYLDFLPAISYVNRGVWTFVLEGLHVTSGIYQMYFPSHNILSADTGFYRPNPERTFTIPSTASRVITVGAYDTVYNAYADFSGRGNSGFENNPGIGLEDAVIKPDLAAPGVNIVTSMSGGGYGAVTGTSFATPFVTGSAALLMEWGITMGNDPYLYGQKVKACLQKGARAMPGFQGYPNAQVGWGKLCVAESLPVKSLQ